MSKIVLVVEGTSDVNVIKSIGDYDYVITGGSAISQETISYIKELVKTREVVVLTDPDFPGMQIRNKIASAVKEVKHAYIDRSKASNGKKLGVAECQKDEIKRALSSFVSYDNLSMGSLQMQDMVELNLCGNDNSALYREKVYKHFNIGYCNAKTMLKRLNMLNVTKEELMEVLNDSK